MLMAIGVAALPAPVAFAASTATSTIETADFETEPRQALSVLDKRLEVPLPLSDRIEMLAQKAIVLAKLDRLDQADATIVEAWKIVPANDEVSRANILMAEADVRSQRQEYLKSSDLCREARTIFARRFGEESLETAQADTMLGRLLISQSKFGEGLERAKKGWDVYRKLTKRDDPDRFDAGFQYAVGLVYSRQSEDAEALLRQLADDLVELPGKHPYQAKLPNMLGTELLMQGRINEAMPWLRKSVDVGERIGSQILGERADNLSVLGIALLTQDRPTEALPFFEKAIAMFGQAKAIPSQAGAYINAGTASDRAGDRVRGLELREKGIALLASLPEQSELALALNRFKLAQSYVHAGRLEEAEKLASQAVSVLTKVRPPTHFQNTNPRISLGWIKARRGRRAEGLAEVKQAFRTAVEANERLEIAQNQVVGVLDNIEAYSQALDTAVLAGDRAFAFEVMQVLVETDASRAAVAVAAREQAGNSALGALLRERQEAAGKLVEANAARLKASAGQAGTDLAALDARLAAAKETLGGVDARLDRLVPGFRDLLRPRRLDLAEAQKRLTPDEVLLVVEESDLGLVTMAVTGKAIAIGRSPLRREEVRALARRLRAGTDAGGAIPFDLEAASALHDAVFTPEIRRLVRPGTRLRIASGDILSAVPFSLLASRSGAHPRWLIEDHALSVVPSLAAMGANAAAAMGGGRLVAIGAPELSGTSSLAAGPAYFDGGSTRAASVAAMPPLPGAAREIAEVVGLLGGKGPAPVVLQGKAASEPAVRALDLGHIGVLLFATHGLVAGSFDARSEPALVLTPPADLSRNDPADDGLLTASEAASLHIDADWVILSACNTAAGDVPSAAGYTGLARAFLFAGARRVVASHWPVRDDVAARLSAGIVMAAQRGLPPDEALRRAILAVMRDRHLPEAGHPALWAPYMVVAR